MRQSKLATKTLKETPKDADNISAALLIRGGFITKVGAGIYSFLPLGYRVLDKVTAVIRSEMNSIGGQEILMPALIPQEMWEESGRWGKMDPPLFVVEDRHEKKYGLGSTHEEVVVDMMKKVIESYQELPTMVYQIQDKFRNEMRSTGGLLRVREFLMKDAYSFHVSEEDLDQYYESMKKNYLNIYSSMDLTAKILKADSGSIGGKVSDEFTVLTPTGEDTVVYCTKCDWAANIEAAEGVEKCPDCGGELTHEKGIEVGHIFKLGTKYSEPMGLKYKDKDGSQKLVHMGCYGIGIGRLMATVIEVHHDEKGMIWPENVAPFRVHLLALGESGNVKNKAEEIYKDLTAKKYEVLFDDRDESAGVKFADSDLLGVPYRVVVSEKTLVQDGVGLKKRSEKDEKVVSIDDLINHL